MIIINMLLKFQHILTLNDQEINDQSGIVLGPVGKKA